MCFSFNFSDPLGNVSQVVLNFLGCQTSAMELLTNWLIRVNPLPESSIVADTNLNIILSHLPLETFLESQDSSVDSVLQLQILGVSEEWTE